MLCTSKYTFPYHYINSPTRLELMCDKLVLTFDLKICFEFAGGVWGEGGCLVHMASVLSIT